MNSRYFLACFCLVLVGCSRSSQELIDSTSQLLIAPDTLALAGVRVDQLRATALFLKLASQHKLPDLEAFHAGSKIRELLLASDGKGVVVIAHGEFAGKLTQDLGQFTLVNSETAISGTPEAIRTAMDHYRKGDARAPGSLLSLAASLPRDAQAWAVLDHWPGLRPETLRQMGNAANLDRILRSLETATLTADLRSGLHAAVTGNCRTDQDATTVSESLRAMLSMMRISLPKNQLHLQQAFDGLQLTQDHRQVHLNVAIPEEVAEKLLSDAH
ncbi:MAG: hypothetical protein U0Q18_33130 [Bryobacteraceae bacterium]